MGQHNGENRTPDAPADASDTTTGEGGTAVSSAVADLVAAAGAFDGPAEDAADAGTEDRPETAAPDGSGQPGESGESGESVGETPAEGPADDGSGAPAGSAAEDDGPRDRVPEAAPLAGEPVAGEAEDVSESPATVSLGGVAAAFESPATVSLGGAAASLARTPPVAAPDEPSDAVSLAKPPERPASGGERPATVSLGNVAATADRTPSAAPADAEPADAPPADPEPEPADAEPDAEPADAAGREPADAEPEPEPADSDAGSAEPVDGLSDAPAAHPLATVPAERDPRAEEDADATPVQPRPARPEPERGRVLAGRYRLGPVVGRGGMGTVWRATDEVLNRAVAVKELRLPSGVDETERRRLITRTLREAKAIAAIRNRGVVTVFDVVDEGARPWIVMELIEGRSLADVIRDDGPLTPRRAAEVGLAVLDVLAAAHRAGIVHRDVKPSNVLIAEQDARVVLTDFGIAKVKGDPSITSTGMLVGAPSYISPERARGDELGPPADLWSLGALLYCAVEGRPPYDRGGAISTLAAVMNDPIDIPESAGPLAEVIAGLLLKDPQDRFDEPVTRAMLREVLAAGRRTPPPAPVRPGGGADASSAAGSPATVSLGGRRREPATPPPVPSSAASSSGSSSAGHAAPATPPPAPLPAQPRRDGESTPPHPHPRPETGGGGGAATAGLAGVAPGGGRPRSRTRLGLMAAAGVVVLALLGLLLVTQLGGDDDRTPGGGDPTGEQNDTGGEDGQGADEGSDAGADEGADEGSDGGADEGTDEGADGGQEPDPDPQDPGAETGGQDPDPDGPPVTSPDRDPDASLPPPGTPTGFARQVNVTYRFSMAVPEGWRQTGTVGRNSGAVFSDPAGGPPKIQVDHTGSPGEDARQAWLDLEDAVRAASTDYRRMSIDTVEWRDYPTVADWVFERTEDGTRVRVLNRGFRVDADRGYAIMVTCVASEWDGNECRTLRETAFDTFLPLE